MIQMADFGRHPIGAASGEQKAKPTHFTNESVLSFLF
jgi:hypothetical protein